MNLHVSTAIRLPAVFLRSVLTLLVPTAAVIGSLTQLRTSFPATPTKWKYRAIYRVGDSQAGIWSDVKEIAVAGKDEAPF